MARNKSEEHTKTATVIVRALEASTDFEAKDFEIKSGGLICFVMNGENCRIKFSKVTGPRAMSSKIDLV